MAAPIRRAWLVIASAALTVSACQDARSTAPVAPSEASNVVVKLQPGGVRYAVASTPIATLYVDPTVDNVFESYDGSRLTIPANSICDVVTSGYGPATWDRGCNTARLPILFSIYSSQVDGHPRITIQPDVRFSPSRTVTVSMRDAAGAASVSSLLAYCPTFSTTCIDESLTDPSLATKRDRWAGTVSRRVKHFSGYSVVFGLTDDGYEGL